MAELHTPPLRIREVVVKTGLSESTIRRAIKSGELKPFRFGRVFRVDESDLTVWMNSKRQDNRQA